ncbi:dehydrogenase of unknown specificity, short-chain alcohol dehydrogenase like protein [Mesorhizobium loti]|nr:dehydrogenase of unknown specificity, short-chain alcohol dehydrogenase like protein [Mesorhizobium loti]
MKGQYSGRLLHASSTTGPHMTIASDDASYITGTTIVVDGGQLLPEGKDFRMVPP